MQLGLQFKDAARGKGKKKVLRGCLQCRFLWGGEKLQLLLTGDCCSQCYDLVIFAALLCATMFTFCYYTRGVVSYHNHHMNPGRSHHLDGPYSFWVPGLLHNHLGHYITGIIVIWWPGVVWSDFFIVFFCLFVLVFFCFVFLSQLINVPVSSWHWPVVISGTGIGVFSVWVISRRWSIVPWISGIIIPTGVAVKSSTINNVTMMSNISLSLIISIKIITSRYIFFISSMSYSYSIVCLFLNKLH